MIELDAHIEPPKHRSRRYQQLRNRLDSVATGLNLLPVPVTQEDVDRIHSFRLLAHAEIQAYLEEIAETILAVSEVTLRRHELTHAAHHLIVFEAVLKLSQKRNASQASYPLFSRSSAIQHSTNAFTVAVRSHRNRIKANNGVKAADLRTLLGPLGYRDSWFMPGFLDQMDLFGVRRGEVAHRSGVIGASVLPTGSAEMALINALMPGLKDLDRYSARLLMPI